MLLPQIGMVLKLIGSMVFAYTPTRVYYIATMRGADVLATVLVIASAAFETYVVDAFVTFPLPRPEYILAAFPRGQLRGKSTSVFVWGIIGLLALFYLVVAPLPMLLHVFGSRRSEKVILALMASIIFMVLDT